MAMKGCRRSAIAAGVKAESMSHSDTSCHRRSQSLNKSKKDKADRYVSKRARANDT
jgi:hypothetical protein